MVAPAKHDRPESVVLVLSFEFVGTDGVGEAEVEGVPAQLDAVDPFAYEGF